MRVQYRIDDRTSVTTGVIASGLTVWIVLGWCILVASLWIVVATLVLPIYLGWKFFTWLRGN